MHHGSRMWRNVVCRRSHGIGMPRCTWICSLRQRLEHRRVQAHSTSTRPLRHMLVPAVAVSDATTAPPLKPFLVGPRHAAAACPPTVTGMLPQGQEDEHSAPCKEQAAHSHEHDPKSIKHSWLGVARCGRCTRARRGRLREATHFEQEPKRVPVCVCVGGGACLGQHSTHSCSKVQRGRSVHEYVRKGGHGEATVLEVVRSPVGERSPQRMGNVCERGHE